jgi:hypothetical protein
VKTHLASPRPTSCSSATTWNIAAYAHLRKEGVKPALRRLDPRRERHRLFRQYGYTSGPHLHFEVYKPLDGAASETYPVKFHTAEGDLAELEEGRAYMRPYKDQKADEHRAPINLLAGVMTSRSNHAPQPARGRRRVVSTR